MAGWLAEGTAWDTEHLFLSTVAVSLVRFAFHHSQELTFHGELFRLPLRA